MAQHRPTCVSCCEHAMNHHTRTFANAFRSRPICSFFVCCHTTTSTIAASSSSSSCPTTISILYKLATYETRLSSRKQFDICVSSCVVYIKWLDCHRVDCQIQYHFSNFLCSLVTRCVCVYCACICTDVFDTLYLRQKNKKKLFIPLSFSLSLSLSVVFDSIRPISGCDVDAERHMARENNDLSATINIRKFCKHNSNTHTCTAHRHTGTHEL